MTMKLIIRNVFIRKIDILHGNETGTNVFIRKICHGNEAEYNECLPAFRQETDEY